MTEQKAPPHIVDSGASVEPIPFAGWVQYSDDTVLPRTLGDLIQMKQTLNDPVNRPKHYTAHPSGIDCIQITEHMGFCLGNAIKYIWRADLKGESIQDLEKAIWYIKREIERRKK
jgi:hypothetical protein